MGKNRFDKVIYILTAISAAATAFIYNKLPEQIPIHWNIKGEIDNYGGRGFIIFTALLPVIMLIFMKVLPKIDPRRENYKKHEKAYSFIVYSIALLMIAIHWFSITAAMGREVEIARLMPLVMGIVFIVIGNFMTQLRHNYFVGIRTPWTLANETVWKKTHRVGGALFVISGILTIIASFINSSVAFYTLMGTILGSTLAVLVYSYLVFAKIKR